MASKSEVTFGTKLANAQKIHVQLLASVTYKPPVPDLSVGNLGILIADLQLQNTQLATKAATYSAAVDRRQRAYRKNADSMTRLLSPISAAVRATYGKDTHEAETIGKMVASLRSLKPRNAGLNPTEKTISQSEASYGSMSKAFGDIVSTLGTYLAYAPANTAVSIAKLQQKVSELAVVDAQVNTSYNQLKPALDARAQAYASLSKLVQRIKEAVKSQYGINSSDYAQLKGLKV